METAQLLERAQSVKTHALTLTAAQKNQILCEMADALLENAQRIMTANEQDMQKAKSQISETMLDRLMLNLSRIEGMAQWLRALTLLEDPIGQELSHVRGGNQDGFIAIDLLRQGTLGLAARLARSPLDDSLHPAHTLLWPFFTTLHVAADAHRMTIATHT